MGGEWSNLPFSKAVLVNPQVNLQRGSYYPFVDMAAVNSEFRWVYAKEKRKFSGSGSRFQHGDTLMARITPCLENGKIARYFSIEGLGFGHGSTEFIVIRGRPGITETDFAYYLTLWEEVHSYAVSHMTGTSGRQRVPTDCFDYLTVPIPPLPEQRAIAHILGTLDDKIELNRRMNQTLEEMARALFKSWFVDFDPVCAKAVVRREHPDWSNAQVSRAACPTLKPEIAELFPDEFENSELGEIPKGWRVSRLGDIADVNWGDTNVTKSSYVNEGYLAYSAKGPDGFLSYYDYDCVGVVVSAIGANSGFTWLARGKWSCIKNTIRFWSIVSDISTEYLYFATHGNNIWPLRGSAQPFISQTDAQNLRVLHPSNGLARKFGDTISPLFDRIDFSIHESRTLAALRDTLLPKLISGVLRVKDAERFLKRMGESFIGVS